MTDLATIKGEAMTSDELDSVAGGIIYRERTSAPIYVCA
jgi:hypothetical protein